jgi:hypothetical protein
MLQRMTTPFRAVFIALLAAVVAAPALSARTNESPPCAESVVALRSLAGEDGFPLAWEETGMADGKPLRVAISERNGELFMEFVKAGEGLWAQSSGRICKAGSNLEARFGADQIRLGPAANWILRAALGRGGQFTLTRLAPERLRIETTGWSGTFVAAALTSRP